MTNTERIEWSEDGRRVFLGVAKEDQPGNERSQQRRQNTSPSTRQDDRSPERPNVLLYESREKNKDQLEAIDLDRTLRSLVSLDIQTGQIEVVVPVTRIHLFRVSQGGRLLVYASPRRQPVAGAQQLQYDLRLVDIRTGNARKIASEVSLRNMNAFSLSPSGSMVAFRVQPDSDQGVFVVRTDTGELASVCGAAPEPSNRKIKAFDEWARRLRPSTWIPLWSADGKSLYWVSDGDLWRSSLNGGCESFAHIEGHVIQEVVSVTAGLAFGLENDTSLMVVTRSSSQSDGFYKVDLSTGKSEKLFERGECYTSRCLTLAEGHVVAVARNGAKLAYIAQDGQHWPEIWIADPDFRSPMRLTRLNQSLEAFRMGKAQRIDWLDEDGAILHGSLILPSNYRENVRYPMIVMVYGGVPISESLNRFGGFFGDLGYLNAQLFATRGMAVLLADAPQHLGTPMRDLAKTVLPGVNKAIEMGIADPDRLGVLGHSYGGYSTLSLIVQTNRFKAAVETDGMADLMAMYGEMSKAGEAFGTLAEHGQSLMGGTPWSHRDRYIENSPIFYLDAVRTPLLMVQGADDTTVAEFLGDEVFVGLRRLGMTVSYAKYQGEGHVIETYANKLDVANRVIAWFETYLSGTAEHTQ
jgi:dipeptidyl aminopeptidase/acylaminoacyl peptidase